MSDLNPKGRQCPHGIEVESCDECRTPRSFDPATGVSAHFRQRNYIVELHGTRTSAGNESRNGSMQSVRDASPKPMAPKIMSEYDYLKPEVKKDCERALAEAVKPTGSEDLLMMTEWAESLCSRLESMDLRHAGIAIEWFYGFAKSKIQRAEELRAIEASSRLSPPNNGNQRTPGAEANP